MRTHTGTQLFDYVTTRRETRPAGFPSGEVDEREVQGRPEVRTEGHDGEVVAAADTPRPLL